MINQTHPSPEIYNPVLSVQEKCEILRELGWAMSRYQGISFSALRQALIRKLNIDIEHPEDPVRMLLLYEYLFALRPAACISATNNRDNMAVR